MNPADVILKHLVETVERRPKILLPLVVADLGCGEGKIGLSIGEFCAVHSFDLISSAPHVQVAEMSDVPLSAGHVDIVIFCLSLMGTNWIEFISEGCRILKEDGRLIIAEVVSRFDGDGGINKFVSTLEGVGFTLEKKVPIQKRGDKASFFRLCRTMRTLTLFYFI